MTDAELVEAVAREVMGWERKATRTRPAGSGYVSWVDSAGREMHRANGPNAWPPRTDANARDEVVERMASQDWRCTMARTRGGYLAQFFRPAHAAPPMWEQDAVDSLGRAVLEAALEAVRASE